MEKGIRQSQKAEMFKTILAAQRPILRSKALLSLRSYGKGYETHTKSGHVKKILAAKRPILPSSALLSLRDDGKRYETHKENMRQAIKAEGVKNKWPRSGRYCQARLSYRYDTMEKDIRRA